MKKKMNCFSNGDVHATYEDKSTFVLVFLCFVFRSYIMGINVLDNHMGWVF